MCSNMLRIKNVLITSSNFSHSFSECKLGYGRFAYEGDSFCRPCLYPSFGRKCVQTCNCSKQRYDTNIIIQLLVQDENYLKNAACALNLISTSQMYLFNYYSILNLLREIFNLLEIIRNNSPMSCCMLILTLHWGGLIFSIFYTEGTQLNTTSSICVPQNK
jgi:hypothetical protein